MCSLAVLVFSCDTNPCKAEEVWQPASPDEEVTELSIMALVGSQFPLVLIYFNSCMQQALLVSSTYLSLHMNSNIWTFPNEESKNLKIIISLNMDLSLLISTTVTLFCIDTVKIRILVNKFFCYIKQSYSPFKPCIKYPCLSKFLKILASETYLNYLTHTVKAEIKFQVTPL